MTNVIANDIRMTSDMAYPCRMKSVWVFGFWVVCMRHSTCLLRLDPWHHQECGRKECGVTPSRRKECGVTLSGRMECGVTLSGQWISLKEAIAHFFLSFLLLPLPSLRNNLFPKFPNRRTTLFSTPLPYRTPSTRCVPPLSCPHSTRRASPLSCPRSARCAPSACYTPPLSCPRCAPSARRHPYPIPVAHSPLAIILVLSATRSPSDPAPLHFVASPSALPVAEPPNRPQDPLSWRKKCPKRYHSRHR